MADMKNDTTKTPSNQNKGSGSDTVSAAKISAGTSVGNPGATPMPQASTGATSPGSTQSSTLASHTSKPLGGQAGSTGAGQGQGTAARGADTGASSTSHGSAGSSPMGATSESTRRTDQSAQRGRDESYDQTSTWARDQRERSSTWASDESRGRSDRLSRVRENSMRGYGSARRGIEDYVSQNPVMVGLVGLAAGLLIGALLPRTRREDQAFGAWADEVRQQGLRYAHEMTERGKDYVEEAFSGDEDRFSRHESEFGGQGGQPGQGSAPGRH